MNPIKIPTRRRAAYISWLATTATAVIACFVAPAAFSERPPEVGERIEQQMRALQEEKATRNPRQMKMDSQLIYAARQKRDGVADKAAPNLRVAVQFEVNGRTKIDIDARVSEALLAAIRAAGGQIINSVPEEQAVRAIVPVESVEALAERSDVKFIRPASIPFTNAGRVNSQGDTTHRSGQTRAATGANGAGIMVGVLSDSINDNRDSLSGALNSGDVDPDNTFLLRGQAGQGSGEGLAMMEIVHDLAPASPLIFATGFTGEAQMAKNIRDLATAGCKIIIDDIGYFNETPFQDGIIAKAINDVSAAGVLYFSSAANSGNLQSGNSGTWEGNFKAGGANKFGQFHLFKQGTPLNTVTQEGGSPAFLFWSDPLKGSSNDYDLVVYSAQGDVVGISNNLQNGTQDPIEAVAPPRKGENIAIYKYSGQVRYLHLNTNRARLAVGTTGNTKGHNASGAPNAFCVAATPAAGGGGGGQPSGPFPNAFNANNKVEDFSSDGFRRIFFNANGSPITPGNFTATGGRLLLKPDITAADGVVTTLPPNSGLNPFFGTSAAAPHAGAIAAQVLSRRKSATPAQVRQALNASAIDILANGIDPASGRGIIIAPRAVDAITNAVGPAPVDANGELLPDAASVEALQRATQELTALSEL